MWLCVTNRHPPRPFQSTRSRTTNTNTTNTNTTTAATTANDPHPRSASLTTHASSLLLQLLRLADRIPIVSGAYDLAKTAERISLYLMSRGHCRESHYASLPPLPPPTADGEGEDGGVDGASGEWLDMYIG